MSGVTSYMDSLSIRIDKARRSGSDGTHRHMVEEYAVEQTLIRVFELGEENILFEVFVL